MKRLLLSATLAGGLLSVAGLTAPAYSQVVVDDDPLHGFCGAGTTCADSGGNNFEILTDSPLTFGFTISTPGSPGPLLTTSYILAILVPTNVTGAGSESFQFDVTKGGATNTSSYISNTTTSDGTWTSGNLDTFLGISASPTNSFGHYAGTGNTNEADPTVTAYDVYSVDLGTNNIQAQGSSPEQPIMTLHSGSSQLPVGAYILGFALSNGSYVATANSGALLEDSPTPTQFGVPPTVPEPASMALLGTGLLGVGFIACRRRRA